MLKLDKKFLKELQDAGVQKLKVFFYEAGCSGRKLNILEDDFEVTEDLLYLHTIPSSQPSVLGEKKQVAKGQQNAVSLSSKGERIQEGGDTMEGIKLYAPKSDAPHLKNARITRTIKADHSGQKKVRYIFTSDEIRERCGCGTSFSFEKKKPKINLETLKKLRETYKK